MRPRQPKPQSADMFRNELVNIIDPRHELLGLAKLLDWERLDAEFGALYAEKGRPGVPTRLMAGIHLLKHMKGVSDEVVCAMWVENPYFQAFCGGERRLGTSPVDWFRRERAEPWFFSTNSPSTARR